MLSVYLESSFFSACVSTRRGDKSVGWKASSLEWWNTYARFFELRISPEVVRELSSPDFPEDRRGAALAMLEGLGALEFTDEVADVADLLVNERLMPGPSVEGDALHVAFCIVHRIDYLLTWNQKHLANPRKRTHFAVICARLNLPTPQIVTPDLMTMEDPT